MDKEDMLYQVKKFIEDMNKVLESIDYRDTEELKAKAPMFVTNLLGYHTVLNDFEAGYSRGIDILAKGIDQYFDESDRHVFYMSFGSCCLKHPKKTEQIKGLLYHKILLNDPAVEKVLKKIICIDDFKYYENLLEIYSRDRTEELFFSNKKLSDDYKESLEYFKCLKELCSTKIIYYELGLDKITVKNLYSKGMF